jgi:hypothetical protein
MSTKKDQQEKALDTKGVNMEVCPACKSAWRPIITRSAEQCRVCGLSILLDCCSGVCDNNPIKKEKKLSKRLRDEFQPL